MTESKHIKAVVTSRRDISSDLWVVRLRPEEKLTFIPGQYVTVALPHGDRLIERPYSVASSPSDDHLEFFLELVPGGHMTPHLYDVPAGGEVLVRRLAKGRFLFDEIGGHARHFMVATVTGVAPFVSMLRNLRERERAGTPIPHQIVLLQAASISRELAYCEELSSLSRECGWFSYIPTVSRIWLDRGWGGEVGRAEDLVRKYLDTLGFAPGETTAYACGNPVMIENVKAILQRAGFAPESFKQEVYWVAEKGE